MSVDVIVLTNGSDLGEKLLKVTWYVAQKLFREYGVEVYVIPYQVRGRVALLVNGREYPVRSPEQVNARNIEDLILSSMAGSDEGAGFETIVIGSLIDEGGAFGGGALVTA